MRTSFCFVLAFALGCSSDAFVQDTPDAATDALGDVHVDADADANIADGGADASCQGAFATPTLVLQHTAQYIVDSFTVTADELHALVTLTPPSSLTEQRKIYALDRKTIDDAFTIGTSQPLDLTNMGPTPGAFDASLSIDGLTIYFSHEQTPDGGTLAVDIYEAQRTTIDDPFAPATKFSANVNDPTTNQFHAHAAGANLYFTVAQIVNGAQGGRDLYVAPLGGGARIPIAELNGASTQEANPVPSRDELEIFFSSDRATLDAGQNLVFRASRSSAALTFTTPAVVPLSVGNGANVTPQYLSPDGCRLYVLVNASDVFVSRRVN